MISLFGFVRLQGAPGIWRIQCAQVFWQHGFWGLSRARECSLCTMTGMQQADHMEMATTYYVDQSYMCVLRLVRSRVVVSFRQK